MKNPPIPLSELPVEKIIHPRLIHAKTNEDRQVLVRAPHPLLFTFPCFSETFCKRLVREVRDKNFEPAPGDPAPGQEFRLDQLDPDFYFTLMGGINNYVRPVLEDCFAGSAIESYRTPFIVRYSPTTQSAMKSHTDRQSSISMAVSLNAGFEGGGLVFPQYNGWSNRDLRVGFATAFPAIAQHHAEEVISGTRYTLTLWTLVFDPAEFGPILR